MNPILSKQIIKLNECTVICIFKQIAAFNFKAGLIIILQLSYMWSQG